MNYLSTRHFARQMLLADRLTLAPLLGEIQAFRSCIEAILYRENEWQVELVTSLPGVIISRHRHVRCDSVDVFLCGQVLGEVEGHAIANTVRGSLRASLLPVPRGAWHSGETGPKGVAYLSFQHWDGEPTFISNDWEDFDSR